MIIWSNFRIPGQMFALSLDHETWIHSYFPSICVFSDHMLRGYMTTQLHGYWLHDYVATWLRGYKATWLYGYMASWIHGYMATRLRGYVVTWLRAISKTTLVPDYQEGARSATIIYIHTKFAVYIYSPFGLAL